MVVVLLGKGGDVDHAVCVDLFLGLILDSKEAYSAALSKERIRICAGGSAKARIENVRKIVTRGTKSSHIYT